MQLFTIASFLAIAAVGLAATVPASSVDGATTLNEREGPEILTCYNSGATADRAPIVSSIDDFCRRHMGTTVTNGQTIEFSYDYGTRNILVSGQALNGCTFKVDNNCNRLLRIPVDGCNQEGVNNKQGGYVTDLCGRWRVDPNYK